MLTENISEAQYRAMPGLNASSIREGMRSMAHMRHAIDTPTEPTESMELGTLVHVLALQPETFADKYAVAPSVDRRTKAGKEEYAAFVETVGTRSPIDADTLATAQAVIQAIKAHPLASKLIAVPGPCEVVAQWTDAEYQVPCKGRLDKYIPGKLALDLKTTRNADGDAFQRSFFDYGYHRQLAWYTDGFKACSGQDTRFVILAVETEAPYGIGIFEPDAAALEYGRYDNRKVLAKYAECLRTGIWPSYPEVVKSIGVPAWARNRYEQEMSIGV